MGAIKIRRRGSVQPGGFNANAYRGASYSPPSPYEQLQTQASQSLVNGASSALNSAIYSLINRVAYR